MSSSTTHPLAEAWLRDLELLLRGVEPGERTEVLAGVREHLDGSLPMDASDDDVRQVLADLGSPQSVADEAYLGRSATPGSQPTAPPVMARTWVPVAVAVLTALALLVVVVVLGSANTYTTTSTSGPVQVSSTGQEIGSSQTRIDYEGLGFFGVLIALVASMVFWVPALVILLLSPLWSAREKAVLALVTPVGALALAELPSLGFALTGTELGLLAGTWTALVLIVFGGGWSLVHLCRAASHAASERAIP